MLGQCVVGRIFEARSSHFENFWQTDKASRTISPLLMKQSQLRNWMWVLLRPHTESHKKLVFILYYIPGGKALPSQRQVIPTVHSGGRDRNLSVFFQSKSFPDVTFSTAITHSRRFDRANDFPPLSKDHLVPLHIVHTFLVSKVRANEALMKIEGESLYLSPCAGRSSYLLLLITKQPSYPGTSTGLIVSLHRPEILPFASPTR